MKIVRPTILMVFIIIQTVSNAQFSISGHVSDKQGENLFAVNVYLSDQSAKGVITDLDGNFTLKSTDFESGENKFLVFEFVGYQKKMIQTDSIDLNIPLQVVMLESVQNLDEVLIEARKSISKEFSIKEMDKLKIYLNPMSSADPLKAIAALPSSTNTDETANPELRGSDANRTKVFFNGVPISNPVKNSQINGIGFFSLFNAQLINTLEVYPSNPPLIYGNSSAGAIEIETDEEIDGDDFQISASLATSGVFLSKKINTKSFVQMYGNLTFSDGFLFVNPNLNRYLKSFKSYDLGVNYHYRISEALSLNFYNYLISESSNVLLNLFTWQDYAKAKTIRDFSVINLRYNKSKHFLSANAGTNFSKSDFLFGNMNSESEKYSYYFSLNYKYLISDNLNIQTGLSNELNSYQFTDDVPLFYYALSPESPSFYSDSSMIDNIPEMYIYLRWKPFVNVILGGGIRKNFQFIDDNHFKYTSGQLNLKYTIFESHSLILSAGRFNSVSEPTYSGRKFRLLASDQLSAEYLYEYRNTTINLAGYLKYETGDTVGTKTIKGFEIFFEQYFTKNLKASISNTILNSDVGEFENKYDSEDNVGYFFVSTVSYTNPKIMNMAISWSTRKGKHYTPVNASYLNPSVGFYMPLYSENRNSGQYGNYNVINVMISKIFNFPAKQLIAFFSVNNILDSKNQKSLIYNSDYSDYTYNYYQGRSIYFGCVLKFHN